MIDLQDLLDRRARLVEPPLDAFSRVIGAVRRRHRRRQALAWGAAMCVLAAAVTTIVARPRPNTRAPVALSAELLGTKQALVRRSELGVLGPTKGAPESVIVTERTRSGRVEISLVHVRTGKASRVGIQSDVDEAAVSPNGDIVAAVSNHAVVVTTPEEPARAAVVQHTKGAEGQVSWDGTGNDLFTRVKGRWVRVSNAVGPSASRPVVQQLIVPAVPGGPILLSVSPGGGLATLFGITYPEGEPPVPYLYIGRFDGATVSDPRRIEIPPGALAGPMGWVGENAFLLAPGPSRAIVVRTDGSKIHVVPEDMDDPCRGLSPRMACVSEGPRLLGTNADGSLLFWKVSAERTGRESATPILVLYYKTWLDGTHGVRLSGLVGRLGPPVAPR